MQSKETSSLLTSRHFSGTKFSTNKSHETRESSISERKRKEATLQKWEVKRKKKEEIKECEGHTGRCVFKSVCSQKWKKNQHCGDKVNKTCETKCQQITAASKGNCCEGQPAEKRGNTTVFIKFSSLPALLFRLWPSSSAAPEKEKKKKKN